jgi:antitoxin ParD1/3/4
MTTMNISLPEALKAFVDDQIAKGGYSSASEYVRELIRRAQKQAAQERLEAALLEGLESGDPIPVTPEFWDQRRAELEKRLDKPRRPGKTT